VIVAGNAVEKQPDAGPSVLSPRQLGVKARCLEVYVSNQIPTHCFSAANVSAPERAGR